MKIEVVRRMRLGNTTEDITSFSLTELTAELAILDGYDVSRVNFQKVPDPDKPPVERLYDLRKLAITGRPNGITYIQSENLFAVNDSSQPTKLFLFDRAGRPQGTRDIQRTNGFVPNHVEGLTYIPQRAPHYPDHLVIVAVIFHDQTVDSRLEVIDRDGHVTAHIFPRPKFLTGVAYKIPDSLLVSNAEDDTVWEIDFQGNILRQSSGTSNIFDGEFQEIEGLAQTHGGVVAAVNFFIGRLVYLDRALNLTEIQSVDYRIGPGLFEIGALAWDTTRNEHLFISHLRDFPPKLGNLAAKRYISAVPPTLDTARRIVETDESAVRMAYLPDERLIAVTHQENNPATPTVNRQSIRLYNEQGKLVEEIDVTPIGHPSGIAYVPTKHQFIVRFRETNKMLTVLTRKGEVVSKIDLSQKVPKFNGFAFFNPSHPSGGQFIFLNTTDGDPLITDFDGNPLGTFKQRELAIASSNISAITTGANAGAFAILDSGNSELVVFRLVESNPTFSSPMHGRTGSEP